MELLEMKMTKEITIQILENEQGGNCSWRDNYKWLHFC